MRSLTGLRFFAAVWVVFYHFLPYHLTAIPFLGPVLKLSLVGYAGISLFFALSGFVLSYVYEDIDPDKPADRRNFWVARFARIYPVYVVSFVLAAPFVIGHRLHVASGFRAAAEIAAAAVASLTLMQAWFWPMSRTWNGPAWTLSVEAFFYLLFPRIAARVRSLSSIGLLGLAGLMWVAAMIVPTANAVWPGHLPVFFVLDDPLLHLPTFIAGVAIGFLFLRRRPGQRVATFCALGGTAIILTLCVFQRRIPYAMLHDGLFIPGFCLLIYGLAADGWPSKLLSGAAMQTLGDASYSVYLLQYCVWWPTTALVHGFAPLDYIQMVNARAMPTGTMLFLVNLAILVALSVVIYLRFEVPARVFLRRRLGSSAPDSQ